MKPSIAAGLPLAAVVTWVLALIFDPAEYSPISVSLLGLGLIVLATVATVGLVLVGGRWAHRSLLFALGVTVWLALVRPLDPIGLLALALTGAGIVALFAPRQRKMVRKLPSAAGPPPRATVLAILATTNPLFLGLIPDEANLWVAVFAAVTFLIGFLYSQTTPGALAALRVGVPALALATAVPMGLEHGSAALVLAAVIGGLAWTKDAAIAFHPLIEKGSTYAIPPEMAPREILDGAGIDDRGRRL